LATSYKDMNGFPVVVSRFRRGVMIMVADVVFVGIRHDGCYGKK